MTPPAEAEALGAAAAAGIAVVQSTRAGSGAVPDTGGWPSSASSAPTT